MINKWLFALVLVALVSFLVIGGIIIGITLQTKSDIKLPMITPVEIAPVEQDQPQFSAYQVKNMVKDYVLHQTIRAYDYQTFKDVEYPIKGVTMYSATYNGNSQWSGQCYANYRSQSSRLLNWLFYEKSRTVSIWE